MRALVLCVAGMAFVSGCFLFPSLDDLGENYGKRTDGDAGRAVNGVDGAAAANADGAASPACPPNALLCDDFEGTFQWDRFRVKEPSTAAVVSEPIDGIAPTSGRAMLRFAIEAGADSYANVEKKIPPPTSGVFAMRAFVRFTTPPAPRTTAFALTARDGNGELTNVIRVRAGQTGVWSWFTSHGAATTDNDSATMIRTDAWSCVEMVASMSGTGHASRFVDDAHVIDVDAPTVAVGLPYDAASMGLFTASGERREEMLVDDVVIATFADADARRARIGCAR